MSSEQTLFHLNKKWMDKDRTEHVFYPPTPPLHASAHTGYPLHGVGQSI